MENDAKFYTEDPYVVRLLQELEAEKELRKQAEIELANLKRQEATGKDLLLEAGC